MNIDLISLKMRALLRFQANKYFDSFELTIGLYVQDLLLRRKLENGHLVWVKFCFLYNNNIYGFQFEYNNTIKHPSRRLTD